MDGKKKNFLKPTLCTAQSNEKAVAKAEADCGGELKQTSALPL